MDVTKKTTFVFNFPQYGFSFTSMVENQAEAVVDLIKRLTPVLQELQNEKQKPVTKGNA